VTTPYAANRTPEGSCHASHFISRTKYTWALAHASLSHHDRHAHDGVEDWAAQKRASPVRVQDEWIREIRDVTALATEIHELVSARDLDAARARLPDERPYPLPEPIRVRLAATE
jgi:hypothetical protein